MKTWTALLAALLLAVNTMVAIAGQKDPADVEGTEDHPEIARFPHFHLDSSKHNDYNEFSFLTKAGEQAKAGKYWFVDYILNDEARQPSAVELMKNYENAFKKAGGSMVFRDKDENAVYRMPLAQGGERWVQMHIDNEGYRYQLTIVDVAAMEQKLEFTADQMADAIRKNGFVALNGILFDTGKASIQPSSQPLIDEMAALLKKEGSLKLTVVGHTDNVGDKKANLELSKKRAESVMKALVAAGIDSKRLKSDGRGDSVPVGDNRTDDGRAKNRRVELVKS
jgi:outer membrane protein OmpA-like peptidoglycan-associated protein